MENSGNVALGGNSEGTPAPVPAWAEKLALLWRWAGRASIIVLALGILGVIACIVVGAPSFITALCHDTMHNLDAAWRMAWGHLPHRDFYSQQGPLAFAPQAIAMHWITPTAAAMSYGSLIASLVLTALVIWIAFNRFEVPVASFVSLYVCTLVASNRMLGNNRGNFDTNFDLISYAMHYNRHAWGMAIAYVLLLYLPVRKARKHPGIWELVEGLVAGFLFINFAFLKITYFVVAIGMLVAGLIIARRSLRFYIGAVGGFILGLVMWLMIYGGDLSPVLGDYRMMTASQSGGWAKVVSVILARVQHAWIELTMLVVLATAAATAVGMQLLPGFTWRKFQPLLMAVLVLGTMLGAGALICGTNSQVAQVSYYGLGLVVLGELLRRIPHIPAFTQWRAWGTATAGGLLLLAFTCVPDILALTLDAKRSLAADPRPKTDSPLEKEFPPVLRIDTPNLKSLAMYRVYCHPPEQIADQVMNSHLLPSYEFAVLIRDGVELLGNRVNPGEQIFAVSWTNPFNYALGNEPPRGDAVCWTPFVVSEELHPPQEKVFADVEWIMEQKNTWYNECYGLVQDLYGEYMDAHFETVAESPYWRLRKRKG